MTQTAIFAAGCFWGVQAYFDRVSGVEETEVGYIGGNLEHPSYEQVCTQTTGHAEAVRIKFDDSKVTYQTLLRHFFAMHDPTQEDGQGPDIGSSYRSAIFYVDDDQRDEAVKIMNELGGKFAGSIVTEITPARDFYTAEDYHQKYFDKTGVGACHIWPDQVSL